MAGAVQNAKDLLEAFAGFGEDGKGRGFRLGRIASDYSGGPARVQFDGETTVSGKGYAWLASYTPHAGDRVALAPVGTSYLILGAIVG